MRKIIAGIFIIFGIMTLFTDAPLWDAVINITIGYLLCEEEK